MAAKKQQPKKRKPKAARRPRDPLRATPPRALPRDTPVETPAVAPPRALIEPPVQLGSPGHGAALATRPETIEAAYEAWDELRLELASVQRTFTSERERLDQQGALLLGAVETVAPLEATSGEALARRRELDVLAAEAKRGLEVARSELEARARTAEAALSGAIVEVVKELRARVARQAAIARPVLELMVRVLPQERRILHLRRLRPDDAITFLFASSGRVPTRYDALFDDATDDVLLPPPVVYLEEGVTELRPKAATLRGLLEARAELWPVKAMLPMLLPFGFVRWLERGAVLEAEVADGDGFRNQLTTKEAEQLTGALLSLKLEGKVELELVRG